MKYLLLILVSIALLGCQQETEMPNPASEYCIEQGGTLDIRDTSEGQVGICVLPDGTECEEWAYMHGECPMDLETCQAEGGMTLGDGNQCAINGKVYTQDTVIDLSGCSSYFDGCNHCVVENGSINGCSEIYCESYTEPECRVDGSSAQEKCKSHGGEWLGEHQECEGISEAQCQELGGHYDSCASACRHDPDAEMCTKQCVFVCDVNSTNDSGDSHRYDDPHAQLCKDNGGKWLEEFNECEGLSEEVCEANDGSFNNCASACRHDPDAEMCTTQCVMVCSW
ncbi:MAG: putative hemolysin [Nanobdellota archaeon]